MEAANAIVDSVLNRRGLTFTVVMARQAGKNELSAQVELFLLVKHAQQAVDAIKCAPTFMPQGYISMRRLRDRITQAGVAGGVRRRKLAARCVSAPPASSSSPPTTPRTSSATPPASCSRSTRRRTSRREKFDREFRPMAASTGATTVYYGTPWDDSTLLEQAVEQNLELQRRDGIRRHFEADWPDASPPLNPDYARYVEAERDRLGENHPLFLTQYALQDDLRRRPALHRLAAGAAAGRRTRASTSRPRRDVYVAGLDIGGQACESGREHDSTVLTIARAVAPAAGAARPGAAPRSRRAHRLDRRARTTSVLERLSDLLGRVWRVRRLAVDATGLGETLARMLANALGDDVVRPVKLHARTRSRNSATT